MHAKFLHNRLRDLQITLQQIAGTIPETTGELRIELERQCKDVQTQIASLMVQAQPLLAVIAGHSLNKSAPSTERADQHIRTSNVA